MTSLAEDGFTDPYRLVLKRKFVALLLLIAGADILLFQHPIGISLTLFLALLAGASLCTSVHSGTNTKSSFIAIATFLLCMLPSIEDINAISIAFAIVGVCIVTVWMLSPRDHTTADLIRSTLRLVTFAPLRMVIDLGSKRRQYFKDVMPAIGGVSLAGWIVPLLAACIFVYVFSQANPLIEKLIDSINFAHVFTMLDVRRALFWALALLLIWPFLFFRPWRKTRAKPVEVAPSSRLDGHLFGYSAILRSLVLFNLIFGWQTLADAAYLWGGAELPDGVTYAQYAQRGAYALIAAALLSAAFLLAAMRPGTRSDGSKIIRILVYIWTAQNILMMISAAMRLYAYVDAYSMTHLRIWAFALILLIGCGFALIVARIALQRSNTWLVATNAAVLAGILYAAAFVNMPRVIADFNISHSREASGRGVNLDLGYLLSLGPETLPSIQTFLNTQPATSFTPVRTHIDMRARLTAYLSDRMDWRSWTWRDARLRQRVQKAYGKAP